MEPKLPSASENNNFFADQSQKTTDSHPKKTFIRSLGVGVLYITTAPAVIPASLAWLGFAILHSCSKPKQFISTFRHDMQLFKNKITTPLNWIHQGSKSDQTEKTKQIANAALLPNTSSKPTKASSATRISNKQPHAVPSSIRQDAPLLLKSDSAKTTAETAITPSLLPTTDPESPVSQLETASVSHMNKMAQHLTDAVNRSATPQRFQVLANILHYYAGVELDDSLLDDPKYYGTWCRFRGVDYFTEETQPKHTELNTTENMLKIVHWATRVAKQTSLDRIVQKFKISDPTILNRIEQALNVLYLEQGDPDTFASAFREIKTILIVERIKKKYPNSEMQKIEAIVSQFVTNKITLKETEQQLGAILFKGDIGQKDQKKLETILTKFPILRQISSPEQVSKKIENEVYGIFHDCFAQEKEFMNNIQRISFNGTEILYRGLPSKALTREQIIQSFNEIHRAIGALGDIGAHQIKTNWNPIQSSPNVGENRGNIASNATATTLDPAIAIKYSLSGGRDDEGWIFEIHPKADQTAISLGAYEERGAPYSEIDFAQIDTKEIKAVHRIKKEGNKVVIVETLENPFYKKRANEKADEPEQGIFSSKIEIDYPQSRQIPQITVNGTLFNVKETESYQRLIPLVPLRGKAPTKDEIQARRAAALRAKQA